MFTRTVEVTPKSGKARELANTINDKVLPILKKQKGFVDETVLVSDKEDNRVLSLSFWNSKEDAEKYQSQVARISLSPRQLLPALTSAQFLWPVSDESPPHHAEFVTCRSAFASDGYRD